MAADDLAEVMSQSIALPEVISLADGFAEMKSWITIWGGCVEWSPVVAPREGCNNISKSPPLNSPLH